VVLATAAGGTVPTSRAHGRAQAASGLGAVIVEPSELGSSAGITAVYDFVLSAKKSVDMTMYELVDPAMVRDLVADDKRHVKVRVILDTNREQSRNGPAFRTLRAGGVKVVWADTSYEATHQKTITVDGTESLILSANLTEEYYSTTRDFGVFDHNQADVRAIEAVFAADFAHEPITPSNGSDLVWSPGSQAQMLRVIDGASHSLSIENEEMGDWTITDALVAAARRGVKVEVTMTRDSSYDSDWRAIVSAGGHVHLYRDSVSDLYIHAKTTVADAGFNDQNVYLGSINFSRASMDYNRELGIVTNDSAIVKDVNAVVTRDYSGCTAATDCSNYD
jgi:cardiolipin synthase